MPVTHRGREIIARLPGSIASGVGLGCEIVRHEELCVGCGTCATVCPSGASTLGDTFDVEQLLSAPEDSRRGALGAALRRVARHAPTHFIAVPPLVTTFRTISYDAECCLGCGACARGCPVEAIEARPAITAAAPSDASQAVAGTPS